MDRGDARWARPSRWISPSGSHCHPQPCGQPRRDGDNKERNGEGVTQPHRGTTTREQLSSAARSSLPGLPLGGTLSRPAPTRDTRSRSICGAAAPSAAGSDLPRGATTTRGAQICADLRSPGRLRSLRKVAAGHSGARNLSPSERPNHPLRFCFKTSFKIAAGGGQCFENRSLFFFLFFSPLPPPHHRRLLHSCAGTGGIPGNVTSVYFVCVSGVQGDVLHLMLILFGRSQTEIHLAALLCTWVVHGQPRAHLTLLTVLSKSCLQLAFPITAALQRAVRLRRGDLGRKVPFLAGSQMESPLTAASGAARSRRSSHSSRGCSRKLPSTFLRSEFTAAETRGKKRKIKQTKIVIEKLCF